MDILQNQEYRDDLKKCINHTVFSWEDLKGKTILISGATGMIGSTLIDLLMLVNQETDAGIRIMAVSRNEKRAKERFASYWDNKYFMYISHDITKPMELSVYVDYIIHGASNTHPRAYAMDPVGTITANVEGTRQLLEVARTCRVKRFLFLSSVEIYGENRGDTEKFAEDYLGYIDCNTMRAGYPEGKRLGETLCNAYSSAYGIDFVIPRLSRVYGPTLLDTDSKALSQFIQKAVEEKDIVLKSEGTQLFSYTYVTDAVTAILTILLKGETGAAYNIADEDSDITLRRLAEILAEIAGSKVIFELPDAVESAGYSKATKALLDSTKLQNLGWKAKVNMKEGLRKTVEMRKNNG